ncbi:Ltp family lipoprotein [Bombilactobacillus mellifer]|nr:Ltp family lipoprotein [Bombilactobacillus mellifer]
MENQYCQVIIDSQKASMTDKKAVSGAKKAKSNIDQKVNKLKTNASNRKLNTLIIHYGETTEKALQSYIDEIHGKKSYANAPYKSGQLAATIANTYFNGRHASKLAEVEKISNSDNKKTSHKSHKKAQETNSSSEDSISDSSQSDSDTSESSIPADYSNALKQANYYCNVQNMSEKSIHDQLVSDAGGKFSEDAAKYALDHLNANWNENALKKAKSYQQDMAMSENDIREQLTSSAGEKFTAEQADYAVQHLHDN